MSSPVLSSLKSALIGTALGIGIGVGSPAPAATFTRDGGGADDLFGTSGPGSSIDEMTFNLFDGSGAGPTVSFSAINLPTIGSGLA
jgi:hypothetical protein